MTFRFDFFWQDDVSCGLVSYLLHCIARHIIVCLSHQLNLNIQAYLGDIAGSVSDHHDKANIKIKQVTDFPGGAVVKNPPANAGDTGSSPGPGRYYTPWSN